MSTTDLRILSLFYLCIFCLSELHTIFPHIKHTELVFNPKYLFRIIQSNFDTNHMGLDGRNT